MDKETALFILKKTEFFYTCPEDKIILDVYDVFKNLLAEELCMKIVIDTSDSLCDKIKFVDIDCPNEFDETIAMKGFTENQLMWQAMQIILSKYDKKENEVA